MSSKYAILGGSFDPVHEGHIHLAKTLLKDFHFETLFLIPTSQNPLKPEATEASSQDRIAMLNLAIANESKMKILTWESEIHGPAYTVDTLRRFEKEYHDKPTLVLGNEVYESFEDWKEPETIRKLAHILVIGRTVDTEHFHPLPYSSTQIRKAIHNAWRQSQFPHDIPGLQHSVCLYIKEKRLYSR